MNGQVTYADDHCVVMKKIRLYQEIKIFTYSCGNNFKEPMMNCSGFYNNLVKSHKSKLERKTAVRKKKYRTSKMVKAKNDIHFTVMKISLLTKIYYVLGRTV